MTTSITIAHTSREIRPTRYVGDGEERRTVRVRYGRGNARRTAINASWGFARWLKGRPR